MHPLWKLGHVAAVTLPMAKQMTPFEQLLAKSYKDSSFTTISMTFAGADYDTVKQLYEIRQGRVKGILD